MVVVCLQSAVASPRNAIHPSIFLSPFYILRMPLELACASAAQASSNQTGHSQSVRLGTRGDAAEPEAAQMDGPCCPTAGEKGAKEANDLEKGCLNQKQLCGGDARDRDIDQIPIDWAVNLHLSPQTISIIVVSLFWKCSGGIEEAKTGKLVG